MLHASACPLARKAKPAICKPISICRDALERAPIVRN
jgi:hypothetical protein